MKMKNRYGDKYLADMYSEWEMHEPSINILCYSPIEKLIESWKKWVDHEYEVRVKAMQCSMYGSSIVSLCCIVMDKLICNPMLTVLTHIMNIFVNMIYKT